MSEGATLSAHCEFESETLLPSDDTNWKLLLVIFSKLMMHDI